MARIRTIKPEFYRHHELYLAEEEYGLPLRVAFSGLWTCADKEGRFKWKPIQLKLDVLPFDKLDFSDVLIALFERGFIEYYEVDGKGYGFIPSFKDHQRITGSEATSESKIPSLPIDYEKGNKLETLRKHLGNTLDDREGKGRERERIYGKEEFPENFSNVFQLEKIYKKTWEEYQKKFAGQKKQISEIVFITWKKFVDFINENNYQDIFAAKFVTPADFETLLTEYKFTEEKWKGVIEKILSTGITPQQNLFFRIPQFMEFKKQPNGQFTKSTAINGITKHNAGAIDLLEKGKQIFRDIAGQSDNTG